MWLRSLTIASALVSVSVPALARGDLSGAQKWKMLLPTVRASTDCIARGIAASSTALSYARQESWLEAVKSTAEECRSFGARLIAEHDRLYGPGTGRTFVEGPYAADLPRAVKARIGPKIARAAAQPAKRAEDEPAPSAAADALSTQPAAPVPLQSNALDKPGELDIAAAARITPEAEEETAQPAKADDAAVSAVVAAAEDSVLIPASQSPVRSDAPASADAEPSASGPIEAAVRESAAAQERSMAVAEVPTVEPGHSAAPLASTIDEKRSSWLDRWSLTYTLMLIAGLVGLAAAGAPRAHRWKNRQA